MRKTTLIALAVALCSTSAAPANQWNRVTVPNGALVYDMAIQGGNKFSADAVPQLDA